MVTAVSVKWLAVKTASEMTYTVSSGALNSTPSIHTIANVLYLAMGAVSWEVKSVLENSYGPWVKNNTSKHTHTRLTALCLGLPRWARTRKVKPVRILLKQGTVSGSGISWAICKSALRCRQISTPAPHHSVFYRPDAFLPPNQQRQSTEWTQY